MEKVISDIYFTKIKTVDFQIDTMTTNLPMKLSHLPDSLPLDGAVRIELVHQGINKPLALKPPLIRYKTNKYTKRGLTVYFRPSPLEQR